MSDDLVDRLVGGRYRVQRKLGAGGMGAVYVALDTLDGDRPVAVKLIRDQLAESPEAAQRFEREARALEGIAHENIVTFLGAGLDDGGVRFIAMELVQGKTLKERIATRGSMPWRETLPILRGVARALEAAHARGLIHRDLKPDNVMLTDGGGVKLLDFGVAKHTTLPEGATMTGTGIVVGTPGFIAPEVVLKGASDDPRSDFYALGATWFEMLTGTKPFDAATPFALAMRHVTEQPPRPSDLRPFDPVPLPVEALLFRLLAKQPEQRPANAAVLLQELDALADADSASLRLPGREEASLPTLTDMRGTPAPGVHTPSTQVMALPTDPRALAAPKETRTRMRIVAACAVALVAVGGGIVVAQRTGAERDGARAHVDAGAAGVSDAGTASDVDAGTASVVGAAAATGVVGGGAAARVVDAGTTSGVDAGAATSVIDAGAATSVVDAGAPTNADAGVRTRGEKRPRPPRSPTPVRPDVLPL